MNLTKLFEGKPIMFSGDTCGLPADVEIMIFAGETEQVMQQEFAKFIGPDTAVHIDPKLK